LIPYNYTGEHEKSVIKRKFCELTMHFDRAFGVGNKLSQRWGAAFTNPIPPRNPPHLPLQCPFVFEESALQLTFAEPL